MTPQEFIDWGGKLASSLDHAGRSLHYRTYEYEMWPGMAAEVQDRANEISGLLPEPGVSGKLTASVALGAAVQPSETDSLDGQYACFLGICEALDPILVQAHREAWLGSWEINIDGVTGTLDIRTFSISYEGKPWDDLCVWYHSPVAGNQGYVTGADQRWQHLQFWVDVGNGFPRDFDAYLFRGDKCRMAGVHHGRNDCGFFATKQRPPALSAVGQPPAAASAAPLPSPAPPAAPRPGRGGLGGMLTVLIGCALLVLAGWLREHHPARAESAAATAAGEDSLLVAAIGGVVTACGGFAIWTAELGLAKAVRRPAEPPVGGPPPLPAAVAQKAEDGGNSTLGDLPRIFDHGKEADLAAFVKSVQPGQAVEIHLRGNYWLTNSCRLVTRLPASAELRALSVRGAPILDRGAKILAALPPTGAARSLAFERCGVTDKFVVELAGRDLPGLQTLSLRNPGDLRSGLPNEIPDAGEIISKARRLAGLEELNLENTGFHDRAGAQLAEAEGLPRLGLVQAKGCPLTPKGIMKMLTIADARWNSRQLRDGSAVRCKFRTDFDGQNLPALVPPELPPRPVLDPDACWRQLLAAPGDEALRARYAQALYDARDWRADVLKNAPTAHRSRNTERILENQMERWRDRYFGDFLKRWGAQLFFADGWPCGLSITSRHFALHAAEIVATLPLRHLNLKGVNDAPEVFDLPQFQQIVTVKGSRQSWSNQAVAALAASTQLRNLRWLDLSKTGLHDEQVEALAASANLPALEIVLLDDNPCHNPVDASLGAGVDGWTGRVVLESISLPEFGRELESRHGKIRWLHVLENFGGLEPKRYRF